MSKSMNSEPNRTGLARRVFQRFGLMRGSESSGRRGRADIEAWMTQRLAAELDLDPSEIDRDVPVDRYGLDSRTAATISGELEEWMGQRIAATALWEHPTLEALSLFLAEADGGSDDDGDVPSRPAGAA